MSDDQGGAVEERYEELRERVSVWTRLRGVAFTTWLKTLGCSALGVLFAGLVVAVVFGVLFVRDEYREYKDFKKYGDREGGRTLTETKDSAAAERVPLVVEVPRWRVPTGGAAPNPAAGTIVTQKLEGEALCAHERRTGLDVNGDGLVCDRAAAEVDREKVEHGGDQGAADVAAGPAADPWVPVKSVGVPPTGRRAATVDLDLNLKTGETRPTITVERARRLTWPNVFEFSVNVPAWSSYEGFKVRPQEWNGEVFYVPVSWRGKVGFGIGLDYDTLRAENDKLNGIFGLRTRCTIKGCEAF